MSTGEQSIINYYESDDPEFRNIADSLKKGDYADTIICRGQVLIVLLMIQLFYSQIHI